MTYSVQMKKNSLIDNLLNRDKFRWKRDKGLVLYTFWAIFQPPIVPGPKIYIFGLLTIILLILSKKAKIGDRLTRESKIYPMIIFFTFLSLYVMTLTVINLSFIEIPSLISTRLTSINQILILTFIEFLTVWYILIQCSYRNYSLRDIIILLSLSCLIQGICAIVALLSPTIRSVFMFFGNKEMTQNAWYMSRRGYGFSSNLLDTFGYGVGLVGGYMLMIKWTKKRFLQIISVLIILLTTSLNARTGLVVFILGFIVNIVIKKTWIKTVQTIFFIVISFYFLYIEIGSILRNLEYNDNVTISWIARGLSQGLNLISGDNGLDVKDVSFFDDFIDLPSDLFQYLFGSGHHVYDTYETLGFRTDIGYINLLWEFGLIGGSIVLIGMGIFMLSPFFLTKNSSVKKIALFNTLSYYLVMLKAILIGYNPGVMVNYLATFSLYYVLMRNKKSIMVLNEKNNYNSCTTKLLSSNG